MATTNTWDQVVSKITGVANRGAFSKTYTPSTSRQTQNGSAGYYSSITTVCNAVSLSGNASTSQVLTGRTFYTTSLTRQTGTMANRGNLNWSGSNTTYSVPAGYYSGGTLDSRTSYNNGVTAGKLGSVSYNNASTVMYGVSYSSGNPYNCTKITNGAQYTFNGATGNFLLAIYGFQGLWSSEFGSISIQKVSGSGTLTQRFAVYNRFPTTSGWTGGEAGTTYFILYQVSNANSTNIRITHNQNGRFRLNGAISFLN